MLFSGEARLTDDVSQYPTISQSELETVLNYILSWPQRYGTYFKTFKQNILLVFNENCILPQSAEH